MGLVTILRGFKAPVVVLDHFLEANYVKPTYGDTPSYHHKPDDRSKFLRTELNAIAEIQVVIPQREVH